MTKTISISIITILFLFSINAQAQKTIKPGKGFDGIKIGMKINDVINKIGKPKYTASRAEEKDLFKGSGYIIEKSFTFFLKFDSIYIFENDNDYAIWKIYTRKNKIVHINVSSYTYKASIYEKVTIQGDINFYDDKDKIEQVLGKEYQSYTNMSDDLEMIYFSKGLRIILNSDKVARNFYFFKPIKGRKKKKMINKLKR